MIKKELDDQQKIENSIAEFVFKMSDDSISKKTIDSEIQNEIRKRNYLKEDWQIHYAVERIYKKIQLLKQGSDINNLKYPSEDPDVLVGYKCTSCNTEFNNSPFLWAWIFGILFTISNIPLGIVYLIFSNKKICPECGQRHNLVKVLNDGREVNIKLWKKSTFYAITIPISIIFILFWIVVFIS